MVQVLLEFLKAQRTVVERGRQAEPIVHKRFLACAVTAVHGAQLRQHDVALIDKQKPVVREIIQKCCGHRTRRASGKHGGVVFDTLAHADFLKHLDVVICALCNALRFDQLSLISELLHLPVHLFADLAQSGRLFIGGNNVVARGENRDMAHHVLAFSGERCHFADAVDFVSEKLHTDGRVAHVGEIDLHDVAAHAELVAHEIHVVPLILQIDEPSHQLFAAHLHAGAQTDDHAPVVDRVTERIDA